MNSENRITRREVIETSGLAAAMLIHSPVYSVTSETSGTRGARTEPLESIAFTPVAARFLRVRMEMLLGEPAGFEEIAVNPM